jgi:hypothetical protein
MLHKHLKILTSRRKVTQGNLNPYKTLTSQNLPFHIIISTLLLHDDDLADIDSVTRWLSLVE